MYKNEYNNEMTYSLKEAGIVLNKSYEEIEMLIKSQKLGFQMTDHGPVISNRSISGFLLGEKPRYSPDYKPESPRKKPRKHYAKARTKR
jgi:hypothetical protein